MSALAEEDKSPNALRLIATVLSSFVGIRKRSDHDQSMAAIKPVHVIVAGLIGAALFVLILVTVVQFIVRSV